MMMKNVCRHCQYPLGGHNHLLWKTTEGRPLGHIPSFTQRNSQSHYCVLTGVADRMGGQGPYVKWLDILAEIRVNRWGEGGGDFKWGNNRYKSTEACQYLGTLQNGKWVGAVRREEWQEKLRQGD